MTVWAWVGIGIAIISLLSGAALWAFRRWVGPVFGPMFWYDVVRLARRGQQPKLRALLVGFLLVGLLIAYLHQFRNQDLFGLLFGGGQMSLADSSKFAETFLIAFLTAQMLAVLLVTPAVAASAITEEKERGTLDFLRGSMLSAREIVLGKLAARLTFVAGIVLAGVPVLALTSLFGGIDERVLFGGYLITGMAALNLAAISVYLAVKRDSLKDVLVWVYGGAVVLTVFGLCCGCVPGISAVSPVSALVWMFTPTYGNPSEPMFWANLVAFVLIHGISTTLFTIFAVQGLRMKPAIYRRAPKSRRALVATSVAPPPAALPLARRAPEADPMVDFDREAEEENDLRAAPRVGPVRRSFSVPRLGHRDPFLWKERYFAGRFAFAEAGLLSGCGIALLSGIVFVFGLIFFILVRNELDKGRWIGEAVNPLIRILVPGAVFALGIGIGTRAAGMVALERQKQTLDGLLTLPVERFAILKAKWLAPLIWARHGFIALGCGWGLTVLVGGIYPLGFLPAVIQAVGWLVFANTLGLWLSVRCRTVTRATVTFVIVVATVWAGPLILAPVASVLAEASTPGLGDIVGNSVRAVSPPVGLFATQIGWAEATQLPDDNQWLAAIIGAVTAGSLMGLLTLLLGFDAVRRFQHEGKE